MAQIVSFIIQKGGCGKTTTTANTGGYLAKQGYRVLCVDMDPQGNLTQHFGFDSDALDKTLLNLFQEEATFDQVILKRSEYLHVLPNNLNTASSELHLYHTLSREFMLRNILMPYISHYDYILIDCPPALGLFSVNALTASTEFVLVVAPEFFPMKAIKPLYETYRMVKQKLNHTLNFNGVLMTMCDFRTNHSQQIYKILKKNFPHKLYDSYIRNTVSLKEAASYGQTIFEYAHNSMGAFDYQNFAEEFIKDHHKNIAKRRFYQEKYESLSANQQKQIMVFTDSNLSQYNKNRLELSPSSKALREAIIVERNKVLENLFPYRSNVKLANSG